MKVIQNREPRTMRFSELRFGQVFRDECGDLFIRNDGGKYGATMLFNGRAVDFSECDVVTPVEGAFVEGYAES